METIGDILRNKRLEKGLTLEDVSNLTKIRKKYLEALESGNYNEIPEKVYVKSFLKIYSDFLELDRSSILKRYQDEIAPEDNNIITSTYFKPVNDKLLKKEVRNRRLLYIIAAIVGIILIVWGINRLRLAYFPSNLPISESVDNSLKLPKEIEPPLDIQPEVTPPVAKHNFDKLVIKIDCIAYSWLSRTIDGKNTISYTMLPNKSETLNAQDKVNLRIGNAYGLKINVNDFDLGNLGKSGEVIELRIILNPNESIEVEIERENGSIEKKSFKD